jgi:hypothetical protein
MCKGRLNLAVDHQFASVGAHYAVLPDQLLRALLARVGLLSRGEGLSLLFYLLLSLNGTLDDWI